MQIDQSCADPNSSTQASWQASIMAVPDNSSAANASLFGGDLFAVVLVLVGSGMQGYANGTIDAFFVAFFLLIAGFVLVRSVFADGKPEIRAFLLTYAVCIFVGGLAQCYSLALFNNPQSTIDSFTFLREISPQPPFTTMAHINTLFNAPLAIVTWQQIYKITWLFGFEFGPYTGVMFNAFVMGLTGSLTVQIARVFFGDDNWRLQRVGILFSFCGLFILFGAVLIRDCFAIFFSMLTLWGLVRWLFRRKFLDFFLALISSGISVCAMLFLRDRTILLFVIYWLLAFLFWFISIRSYKGKIALAHLAIIILIVLTPYLVKYTESATKAQTLSLYSYAKLVTDTHSESSLGKRLIINQPLPIRLVLGSGAMLINPIPLWSNFNLRSLDYGWIKGYHGIYQILLLPLICAGFIEIVRIFRIDKAKSMLLIFLSVYFLISMLSVVATSMETRHLAQFMPALMIIAALPDTREKSVRKQLYKIAIQWFVLVVLVHIAWVVVKL